MICSNKNDGGNMKNKKVRIGRFILIGLCIMGLFSGCSFNEQEEMDLSEAKNGRLMEKTPSMEMALASVKSKAKSLIKNDLGYWEADFGDGLVMIYIPAGSFTMGNEELSVERVKESYTATPAHDVQLSHYWISKTPTTIGQFRKFVEETNYVTDVEKEGNDGPFVYDYSIQGFLPKKGYHWDNAFQDVINKYPEITINDKHPVTCISWNDAIAYTNWLKKKTDLPFTLPTEAEWEFAARGNDGRVYPWGNDLPDGTRANYADETFDKYFPNTEQSIVHKGVNDGYGITSPVGMFPNGQSPVGALDMAGNVTEWIYDSEYGYTREAKINPIAIENNGIKMQKAGFWAGSAGRVESPRDELLFGHNIRSDARQGDDLNSADDHLGFRIGISYIERE
jgi:formylglycine-generating enzyme required for sulfatase activity